MSGDVARPAAPSVRVATEADAAALLAIYTPFVTDTAVSFETEPPSVAEFTARLRECLARWAWLVAECDGVIAGYAYGGSHRARAAYRWSVETSAYLDPRFQRRGIGTALYRALLDALTAQGYCNAYAGATLPNDASVALHRRVGFEPIGVFRRVGYKFGRWHDVAWMQCSLREAPDNASS